MRLKTISLVGFKSFADRTKFKVDAQMIAVVGPNGCGKSNIVDAIRWAMGESRASQLRQETSSDMIFNGSATRRAMDICSVEMHLSNDGSRDLGMWKDYSELSVRRQIERDGESNYFINGQRVRRRDVSDLFSGTGAGARSYGVVEQEQITKIVQADPKRIRGHLEEAAGIAIYKERRRETERRLIGTEENLERLADITKELERQMDALARQANQTVKVRKFKQQLEELRSLEMQLRVEEMEASSEQARQRLKGLAQEVAKARDVVSKHDKNAAQVRSQRQKINERLGKLQGLHYDSLAELEQVRQRQREFDLTQEHERKQLEQAQRELAEQEISSKELEQTIEKLSAHLKELERQAATLDSEVEKAQAKLAKTTQGLGKVESIAESANRDTQATTLALQKAESEMGLAKHRCEDLERNLEAIRHELGNLAPAPSYDGNELSLAKVEVETALAKALANETKRQQTQAELIAAKEDLIHLQAQSGGLQAELDLLLGLPDDNKQTRERDMAWLRDRGEAQAARLMDEAGIKAPSCERALDSALSHVLDGYLVGDLATLASSGELPSGLVLVDSGAQGRKEAPRPLAGLVPLLDKVQVSKACQACLARLLQGVYLAPDMQAALAVQAELEAGEVIVTLAGELLRNGVVEARGMREGGIAWSARRKQAKSELDKCEVAIASAQATVDRLDKELKQFTQSGEKLAQARQQAELKLSTADAEKTRCEHASDFREEQVKRLEKSIKRLSAELVERKQEMGQAALQVEKATSKHEATVADANKVQTELAEATQKADHERERYNELKGQVRDTQLTMQHELQRREDLGGRLAGQRKLSVASAQRISEMRQQIAKMGDGDFTVDQQKASAKEAMAKATLEACERDANQLAANEVELEQSLAQARTQLDEADTRHRDLELDANSKETEVKAGVRQLEELGGKPVNLDELRKQYPSQGAAREWIEKLLRRIETAGPINYAADAEHAACEQRMSEIKTQCDDLETAIASLKAAIGRIDREMLARLRDVFAQLNERFSALFSKLFDGGTASIEIVGDSLLTDGLELRATPPGKKVSHIQALSGGEKTLSALAFLFALNDLNPPPFCILDEVDAALDETNTMRYCRLIESMRSNTQFLVITHNKLVIESVDKLIGVTQEEKGVSKLVAVHIDEAVANAIAATGS